MSTWLESVVWYLICDSQVSKSCWINNCQEWGHYVILPISQLYLWTLRFYYTLNITLCSEETYIVFIHINNNKTYENKNKNRITCEPRMSCVSFTKGLFLTFTTTHISSNSYLPRNWKETSNTVNFETQLNVDNIQFIWRIGLYKVCKKHIFCKVFF